MAEFIDVMKKARTMCAETEDCSPACPVYGLFDCGCPLTELLVRSNDWLQKVEQKIMGWEKPNPEPKPCPFCGGKSECERKAFWMERLLRKCFMPHEHRDKNFRVENRRD